jgi:hypothetical protein
MEPIFVGMATEIEIDLPEVDMIDLLKEEEEKNGSASRNDGSGNSPRDGESNQSNNA